MPSETARAKVKHLLADAIVLRQLSTIKHHIDMAKIDANQVDTIMVVNGPGSFTGVRIGIATARAIAMALNIPVYGVTNFEAYSYSLTKPVTVVLDSKRDDYFVQKFDANGLALGSPKIATAKQLKRSLPFVAVGSGANKLAGEIGCKVLNKISPTAVSVGRVALTRLDHPMPASPLYLREADVTV